MADADKAKEAAATASPTTAAAAAPPPAYTAPLPTTLKLTPLATTPTIADPISYTTGLGAQIYYSKASQEYFLITANSNPAATPGAAAAAAAAPSVTYYLLHAVPKTTISKDAAKRFLHGSKDTQSFYDRLPAAFPAIPASPDETILPSVLVYINAVHDSLLVKRISGTTSLAQFFADRWHEWGAKQEFLFLFRENHASACTCRELETVGNVVYCKGCTTYYLCTITPGPDGTSATMQYSKITTVGQLSFSGATAVKILVGAMCGGTTRLVMDKAMLTLQNLFRFAKFDGIPVSREQILYWALRDSLFVAFPQIRVCWYDQWFGPQAQAQAAGGNGGSNAANGVVVAVGLARLGLAIATMGMIS